MVAFGSQRTACRSWFSFHQGSGPTESRWQVWWQALSTELFHWPLFMSNNVPYTQPGGNFTHDFWLTCVLPATCHVKSCLVFTPIVSNH